jgi:1-aminocyclopropane-1-carboxylate deaminase
LHYQSTPIQEIHHSILEKTGVRLLVKREDLNHPLVSGNKWWKLKYNLEEALRLKKQTVVTFGGAFSNHIYATAAAAKEKNLKSIGLIRGEETLPLNATLSFVRENGMELRYISREEYRRKDSNEFLRKLEAQFGDFYLIPEGGTNDLAVKGCAEYAQKELATIDFDHLFIPVGTGGTIAGLICGFCGKKEITGVTVLKNGEFLKEKIEKLVYNFSGNTYEKWSLLTSYHHGGYAKLTDELLRFISVMKEEHKLPLDTVYTGKLMWAVMKEIEQGKFRRGSTVLAFHTGGVQNLK